MTGTHLLQEITWCSRTGPIAVSDSPTVTRLVVTTDLSSEFAATWSCATSQKNYRRSRVQARVQTTCSGNFVNIDGCTNINNLQRRHWTCAWGCVCLACFKAHLTQFYWENTICSSLVETASQLASLVATFCITQHIETCTCPVLLDWSKSKRAD